jgi:hypothetical protein
VLDPYAPVATVGLSHLAKALDVLSVHADLNHRYRKLMHDSRQVLGGEEIRRTQARGIAKKLLVLAKAAGPDFRAGLPATDRDLLDAGLAQANELISESIPARMPTEDHTR